MLPPVMRTWCRIAAAVLGFAVSVPAATAQWLNHPTPGIPKLPDGKPNLLLMGSDTFSTYAGRR